MLKIVVAGTTALFLTASPIANAQTSQTSSAAPERLNAADRNTLTDMRIDLVKAALQLTPDQEKYMAGCRERHSCQGGGSESPSCKNRRNSG